MMKVGIYHGKNSVGIEERPIPGVGPKDGLVRFLPVEFVGQILIS
ncbi:hypothetical protein NST74_14200 [Paenibacillus sp. FSL F4-0125]